jgi:hypothetical protein
MADRPDPADDADTKRSSIQEEDLGDADLDAVSGGSWLLPGIGDEVLVLFEQGDAAPPFVVGRLWNGKSKPPG